MILHIANPIYDSVFKYIMEDERIAKTILSALLKKDVIKVVVRPHEYTNITRDRLSMFRIDFAATVREKDTDTNTMTERVVLIELQKTWLPTETLRFRQYLGAQYSSKLNMKEDTGKGYAYPMVAVYLLGHHVGSIKEPVIYVNHDVYDYNGNIVKDGIAEPFVESLTHNSIIVQIPRLHGNVNNRLEKVLSVFDQTRIDTADTQVLNLDEDKYVDDDDMMYMLHRLTAAAADSEMRHEMNVEDEYFQLLEDRETALMVQENKLKEKEKKLQEQDVKLQEQDVKLQEQDVKLQEQDVKLQEQGQLLSERDAQLSERDAQLSERDAQLKKLVRVMLSNGMTKEAISKAMGIDVDKLNEYSE